MIDKTSLEELLNPNVIDTPTAIYIARLFAHDPTVRALEADYGQEKVQRVAAVARTICLCTINAAMSGSSEATTTDTRLLRQLKDLSNRHDTAEWYEFPDDFIQTLEDTYLPYDASDVRPYEQEELDLIYGALVAAGRDPGQAYGLSELMKPTQRDMYA